MKVIPSLRANMPLFIHYAAHASMEAPADCCPSEKDCCCCC
jgi:hypothetical protein